MTQREKIAISVLSGSIIVLLATRIFVEQILIEQTWELADILHSRETTRVKNAELEAMIAEESSLHRVQVKAELSGFVPAPSPVVIR